MTIKQKIRILTFSICLLMVLLSTFMLWKLVLIRHDLKHVHSCTNITLSLQKLRYSIYEQEHQASHLLIWEDENYREGFQDYSRNVKKHFEVLKEQRSQQETWDGIKIEASYLSNLEADYTAFLASIETVFTAYDSGRTDVAKVLLKEQAEDVFLVKLSTDLDQLFALRLDNIQNLYKQITAHVGFLPWLLDETLFDVNESLRALAYAQALDKTNDNLSRMEMELMNYLSTGNLQDLEGFWFLVRDNKHHTANLHRIISQQEALGIKGEEEDRQSLNALEAHLLTLLSERKKMIQAKQAALNSATAFMFDDESHERLERQMEQLVDVLLEDANLELREIHNELFQRTTRLFSLNIVLFLLASGFVLAIIFRWNNQLLASLEMLGEGADLIRRGEFGQSIDLQSNDELGDLSTTLNFMSTALKDKHEELQRFIQIVSHDLRAPLVSLHGFAHILREDISALEETIQHEYPMLTKEQQEPLSELLTRRIPESIDFISSSASRMDRLVDAILKLSRAGQIVLRPEPVKLAEVVEVLLGSIAHQISSKNVVVTVGSLPEVIVDPLSIEQILGNLIDNALKYLDPDRPGEIQITSTHQSGETVIQVKDNGSGISTENQSRIFDLFKRGVHPDIPGEGLGLAYVKTLLVRQGGRIWCESVPGQGSSFNFTLTCSRESQT